jgi:NADPH:quinone reductase-like Zn-dependent oxidoreductase
VRFSWEEAAAFPLATLTAYRALFEVGGLLASESVLILGAGSGVSTLAISLAVQAGARVVVTSSSQEKIDRAKELGAEGGVLYTEEGWAEAVGPVDVVLDSVGSTWRESLKALRRGGQLVVYGGTRWAEVTLDVRALYLVAVDPREHDGLGPRLAATMRMVDTGGWQPVIDSVRPWPRPRLGHTMRSR